MAARRVALAAALLGAARLSAQPCEEPARLAAEAEALLAGRGAEPDAVARARDLYRKARLAAPSLLYTLRGADLALAAGDEPERTWLLSAAAAEAGGLLTAEERLALARAAEGRGDRREAILQYGHVLALLQRGGGASPAWIGERIRRLDAEEEAGALPARPGLRPPADAARREFEEGKRWVARNASAAAREAFRRALRASPWYVEAALALGALEAREGRTSDALAAYRMALAADPDRFEAALSLANLLWDEPDRQAKEESLGLLDRALALSPELPRLYRDAAMRWAAWGDAARALERLEAYRARVPDSERAATDALRERLLASLGRSPAGAAPAGPVADSPAARPYQLAQVLFRRGDATSLASALALLGEAAESDPGFAPALELSARIHEMRGEEADAEADLRRAVAANPARAAAHEALAELLSRRPGREAEALAAWRDAEQAGSRDALVALARNAARAGRSAEAQAFFRRYIAESPEGPYAEEAAAAVSASERAARRLRRGLLWAGLLALTGSAALAVRRWGGLTLEEWLRRDPARTRDVRAGVGRLRHETLKHGGLLLEGAAAEVLSAGAGPVAAERLAGRLFGGNGSPGLVAEGRRSLEDLAALGRRHGVRLNLVHKDPILSPMAAALSDLERAREPLAALAAGRPLSEARRVRLGRRLAGAAGVLSPAASRDLGRLLDEVGSTPVKFGELESLLGAVAREAGRPAPPLAALGLVASGGTLRVRIDRSDWETLWRNLFENALVSPRLGLDGERRRDPSTGALLVRMYLFDADPRPLTAEWIRGRPAEQGLGVVADIARRNDGLVDVTPAAPESGFLKGVLVELPGVEEER